MLEVGQDHGHIRNCRRHCGKALHFQKGQVGKSSFLPSFHWAHAGAIPGTGSRFVDAANWPPETRQAFIFLGEIPVASLSAEKASRKVCSPKRFLQPAGSDGGNRAVNPQHARIDMQDRIGRLACLEHGGQGSCSGGVACRVSVVSGPAPGHDLEIWPSARSGTPNTA